MIAHRARRFHPWTWHTERSGGTYRSVSLAFATCLRFLCPDCLPRSKCLPSRGQLFKRSAARESDVKHVRAPTVIKFFSNNIHEDRQSDLHGEGRVQPSQHEQRERGHVRSESSWQPRYAPRILLSTQRNTRTPVTCAILRACFGVPDQGFLVSCT